MLKESGCAVAMSWFVVVKNGVTNPRTGKQSTFKLIVEHAEAMNAITGAPRYCAA